VPGYGPRLEAFCAKERFFVDKRLRDTVTAAGAAGFLASSPMNFIERFADAYRAEMETFVEMIRSGRPPVAGVRDGLEAQRLAEAAVVSLETKLPVRVEPNWRPNRSGTEMSSPDPRVHGRKSQARH
jgi:myo-inositol 2-dehydrogenase / D-chiro-inositol 1-dehydrogenase